MSVSRWPPPGFPIVTGLHAIDDEWSIDLPDDFARRVEDGDLVLWRPGITLRISTYTNEDDVSREQRLGWFLEDASPRRTAEHIASGMDFDLLTYELLDENDDGPLAVILCFAVADQGHLQLAISHEPRTADLARDLAAAVRSAD